MTTADTSTFIAATTDETITGVNPVITRRAPNAGGATEKHDEQPGKEIRRDSKGFENFDDYFDSDGNDTTMNTAGEKTNDDSEITAEVQEAAENQEKEFSTSVPQPTENMPEDILDKDKDEQKKAKAAAATLEKLSEEWDVEEEAEEEQPQLAAAEQAAVEEAAASVAQEEDQQVPSAVEPEPEKEQETIENIENFLEESETAPKSAENPEAPEQKQIKGEKGKEEWVTVIFGEDGKQIEKPNEMPKAKKSDVYDLDDEDFSATKATPFPNRKKSLAKTEGVTRIGNNTYYYTGEGEAPEGGETEDDELEAQGEDSLITAEGSEFDDTASEAGSIMSEGGTPGKYQSS